MDKIDILGRTSVVEQLINILEGLRECGQSMTFSLNGKWGSGKTFVLDLLYERINNVDNKDMNIPGQRNRLSDDLETANPV